ncbi:MAG: ferrous iron transport protein B [Clostridia bacterium]|nr:ferrous iron transport protein B [Clostridia bacterium]
MGLTNKSTGKGSQRELLSIKKKRESDTVVALAGNPNVGKSTIFNALTGMNQHTGNWPGKTVSGAEGTFTNKGKDYILVDLPGTYSLLARSGEEEIARDFICFGGCEKIIVACDASCLERNLNLLLQITEINKNVLLCVNLMDEAEKKGIKVNLSRLSEILGIRVVGTSARSGKGLDRLRDEIDKITPCTYQVKYDEEIESAISKLLPYTEAYSHKIDPRFLALKLIDWDLSIENALIKKLSLDVEKEKVLYERVKAVRLELTRSQEEIEDQMVKEILARAEEIAREVVDFTDQKRLKRDEWLDKITTGRLFAFPCMMLLLALVFYITISLANYPSALLGSAFTHLEELIYNALLKTPLPVWINQLLCMGVIRVVGWIVSVMLPPMAIFFPLFTLLEDWGYLPRVAFNLDKCFQKCGSCGKQALSMCMGFGCNSAGVVGCRIIDSERERLISILTNAFVPCNGRFPTMIMLLTIFFASSTFLGGITTALYLFLLILLGIFFTLLTSKILSKTILKGKGSSFILELPSYRRPQIAKTLIRSIFDRTIFVLARAVVTSIPAGIIIWVLSNVAIGNASILAHISSFLDPVGRLIGMDGVIILAFILGLPANEIIIPIALMAYTSSGTLVDIGDFSQIATILTANGWNGTRALCVIVLMLFHSPCLTTLLTIKKETGSVKWALLSALIPTAVGVALCFIINMVSMVL